jgi:hypothetical protein
LEDNANGKADETKLSKNTMKLFDKALTSFQLHDFEQFVLSMEHVVVNWILNFNVATLVTRNPKLLDKVKPQIKSYF